MVAFLWIITYYLILIESLDKLDGPILDKINEFTQTNINDGLLLVRSCKINSELSKTKKFPDMIQYWTRNCDDQKQKVLNNIASILHKLKSDELKEINDVKLELKYDEDKPPTQYVITGLWHYLALLFANTNVNKIESGIKRLGKESILEYNDETNVILYDYKKRFSVDFEGAEVSINTIRFNYMELLYNEDYIERPSISFTIIKELLKQDIYTYRVSLYLCHNDNRMDFSQYNFIDKKTFIISYGIPDKNEEPRESTQIINFNSFRVYEEFQFQSYLGNTAFELNFKNIIIGNNYNQFGTFYIDFGKTIKMEDNEIVHRYHSFKSSIISFPETYNNIRLDIAQVRVCIPGLPLVFKAVIKQNLERIARTIGYLEICVDGWRKERRIHARGAQFTVQNGNPEWESFWE